jgi:hypothetical protein
MTLARRLLRIDVCGHWNWVFQNADVVIHVVRPSRGAAVLAEVLGGHRPALWGSDLYGAQQGYADGLASLPGGSLAAKARPPYR